MAQYDVTICVKQYVRGRIEAGSKKQAQEQAIDAFTTDEVLFEPIDTDNTVDESDCEVVDVKRVDYTQADE